MFLPSIHSTQIRYSTSYLDSTNEVHYEVAFWKYLTSEYVRSHREYIYDSRFNLLSWFCTTQWIYIGRTMLDSKTHVSRDVLLPKWGKRTGSPAIYLPSPPPRHPQQKLPCVDFRQRDLQPACRQLLPHFFCHQ